MDAVHGASARILPCCWCWCLLLPTLARTHANPGRPPDLPGVLHSGPPLPYLALPRPLLIRPLDTRRAQLATGTYPPTTRRTCLSGIVGSQLGKCLWPQAPPPSPQHTSPRLTPAFILFSSGFFVFSLSLPSSSPPSHIPSRSFDFASGFQPPTLFYILRQPHPLLRHQLSQPTQVTHSRSFLHPPHLFL